MQATLKQTGPRDCTSECNVHRYKGDVRAADGTFASMRPRDRSAGHFARQRCSIREQYIEAATYQLDLTAKLDFPNVVDSRLP